MQRYRLLRNNRESGPYSQQDLIDLGLKAYDLIWMEGKSSSWKYPSEVESLKPFAPPATDDFYVLFHTPKLAHQDKAPASITTTSTTTTPKIASRRYVSVILPTSVPDFVASTPKPSSQSVIQAKEEHLTEIFKDDSKIAVPETIPYKSNFRYLIAAAFLVLLATGIYFGTAPENVPADHPDIADQLPGSMVSLTSTVSETGEKSNDPSDPPALRPNKLLEFAAVKRFVQVSPADYQVGFFGGIAGLHITVKNSGMSRLTNIVIAVDYIVSNKSIHHTEKITIPAIDPQKSITVAAPDSYEGIAIQTRVIGVNDLLAN
ncbi:hypothetical protein [Flavihumibacter fluvii]|uniref:hypothetical protein n=1 Tax=Flavihumibacter fluvii TaxID=2838157 RepID=UPI001BDEEB1D|nr:hypothetical protein [Flavihumibacter fluvii]ULQ53969.1 hypothetical protein KJS93_06510 [Flavihumibacter fluvii]